MTEGYLLIHNVPRMLPDNHATLALQRPIAFLDWLLPMLREQFANHLYFELSILAAAMASPLLWILLRIRKLQLPALLFIFWLTLYTCCWLWLANAPDYRYGFPFLTVCVFIPLLTLSLKPAERFKIRLLNQRILSLLFILTTAYYCYGLVGLMRRYIAKRTEPVSWKEGWLVPPGNAYYKQEDKNDPFPYRMLNAGVKLYLADRAHRCINAGIVCAFDGNLVQVEMRGQRVEDGFRPTDP